MNDRRTTWLIGLIAVGAVLYGGNWFMSNYIDAPAKARQEERDRLTRDIKKLKADKGRIETLIERLDAWKLRSLPENPDVARSLYRSWLYQLAMESGLKGVSVDSGSATNRSGMLQVFSFSCRARGDLSTLTRFLTSFYRTDQLHQIQSLGVAPVAKSSDLDVTLAIQALAVKGSPQTDRLPNLPLRPITDAETEANRWIARRNVFGLGGSSDPADRTVLTAVTSVDGTLEVWFTQQIEDKLYKYRAGDEVDFGRFQGKLIRILKEDIVLQSREGDQWLVSIGESLGEALPIPPEP